MLIRVFLFCFITLLSGDLLSADYYWIGGNGNWNDHAHWANNSGGIAQNSIPGTNDNVIIDDNSGNSDFSININSNIQIKNLSSSISAHHVSFTSSNYIKMSISGSVILSEKSEFKVQGDLLLIGSGSNNILHSGQNLIHSNISISTSGTYTLSEHLSQLKSGTLELVKGTLKTNGFDVFTGHFVSKSSKSKHLNLSSSNIYVNQSLDVDNSTSLTTDGAETIFLEPSIASNYIVKGGVTSANYKMMVVCNSPPNPITVTMTVTSDYNGSDVSCNGDCDGEITVTASSSSGGPYSYDFGNVGTFTTQTVYTGLCVGNYVVVVKDSSQEIVPGSNQYWTCSENINITEPAQITFGVNFVEPPSCPGFCDGFAIVSAQFGTGSLSIDWANGESGNNPVMMCTGSNLVTVTDDNGCTHNDSVVILSPPTIYANVTIQDVSCNSFCDGHAVSNAVGGNGAPYTFDWSHDPAITIDSAGSLCAGTYTLTVFDQDGCEMDTTFDVAEPIAMQVNIVNQINLVCFNQCIGELELNTINGTAPYTYQWFDAISGLPLAAQDNDEIADNLCAGDYFAIVTDDQGCTFQTPNFTITQPTEIIPTINVSDVNCFGECNGVGSASAVGGTPGYTFEWFDNATSTSVGIGANINTLCAGDYYVEVTDIVPCTVTSAIVSVGEPTEVTGTVTPSDVLCAGQCTGSAVVVPAGGIVTGNYTIEWHNDPGAMISSGTSTSIGSRCQGDYFAVIIDDNGCDDTLFFTINEPAPIVIAATSTPIQCNGDCDGTIDANATGGTGTLDHQWFDCNTSLAIGGETSPTITNLCPGSYYVEITDDNNCVVNNSGSCITMTDPPALSALVTSTQNATCGGACDGEATATTNGGTGTLTVTWHDAVDDSQVGTGNTISTLCTGNYYAVVTDANGCTDTTTSFTINDLILVTGVVSSIDATCDGFCNGSASVVPAGGTPAYNYEWVEVATSTTILNGPTDNVNGLCAGDYTVQITDVNGCASPPIAFTINGFPPIIADVTVTDATCNGDCDGSAVSNASGGDGNLTFTWTNGPGINMGTNSPSQMCATSYNLHIEDGVGCFIDTTITIAQPDPYVFTTTITHETCDGDCDGEILVNLVSGGIGTITYTYSPGPTSGQGTSNGVGFCPGNYTCTIQDQNGCDSTFNFTINAAPAINFGITLVADNDCNGDCDGVIQANATGGTGTLVYSWSPGNPNGQGTPTITDLCQGNYTVIVTDDNGCTETGNETITEPSPFDITTSFNDAGCFGACDGDATVVVNSGGTPNYNYLWDDPFAQTTPTANALCAGTWSVTITDQNGCDSIIPFTIQEAGELTITVSQVASSCFGACSGELNANVNGGTPNYTIEWFDNTTGLSIGQFGTGAFNLCPGDYFAIVTDNIGCSVTSSVVTITENPEITATIATTQSNCVLCDGTATVTASGGTGVFVNYTWTSAPGTGQGTPNGTNMCAGVYTVLIEDSDGCTQNIAVTVDDVVSENITPSTVDVLCFGDCTGSATGTVVCSDPVCTFQWYDGNGVFMPGETNDNITNQCAGDYLLEVTNGSGCVSTQAFTINEGNEITFTSSFSDPECNGGATGTATVNPSGGAGSFSFNWVPNPLGGQGTNTATGLGAGNWDVTISDLNGCSVVANFVLTDPPVLDASSISSSDISCFGLTDGSATAFPTGGVGTYTYEWFECITDNPLGQTTQQATGLGAGSYYAIVTDQNNCSQTTPCVDVVEPAQLTGVLSGTNVTCNGDCNGSVQVVPQGGINNYDYQWFDLNGIIAGATGDIHTNACAGTYSVEITDLNGCVELISSVDVTEPGAFAVSTVVTDASCFGICDGTADITVSGGTQPYSYVWTQAPGIGQGTANGSQMCADTYSVLITDVSGCDTTITIVIGSPTQMVSGAVVTEITCNGDNDGAITTSVSGGAGGYAYNWTPNGETTPSISGLGPDNYTVNIQDADGCVQSFSFTLIEPTEITASFATNNSTCNQCDGSASISVLGGYGGYNYVWTPGGQTGQVATSLCAGVFSVEVTDQGGCIENFAVTVSDIGAEVVTTDSTDATCFDSNDGTATANFVCADPVCVVEWFDDQGNSIGQTNTTATGLDGGDYFVQVTNNSGCISVEPVTVLEPSEIEDNEIVTQITCVGDVDGQIEVNPTGGSGAGYIYLWSGPIGGGQGTNTATGLGAGTYDVLITDSDGCDSLFSYTIAAPTALSATTSSTDILCNGGLNGSAEVSPTGGSFPYVFQWFDAGMVALAGETNSTISGLGAGDYFVTVEDLNGCTILLGPITINEPVALSATISGTDVLCFGDCTGTGDVVITGGTGPYTTNWFDGLGNATGQSGTSVTALCPDDYNAIVIDNNGCTFTTPQITVGEPPALTATVASNDASCDGTCDGDALVTVGGGIPTYLFNWLDSQGNSVSGASGNSATNLCEDTYTVEVFDQNGCSVGPLPFDVLAPSVITATIFVNDASCSFADGEATVTPAGGTSPYFYQWFDNAMNTLAGETSATITGIAAGTYFVEILDNAGCTELIQVDVSNLDGPIITINSITDITCFGGNDGAADISISGVSPPFTQVWNPGGQVGEDLVGVTAGNYTVTVTDNAGCVSFETVTINAAQEITATFSVTDATCGLCDGEIVANGSGGTGVLNYNWTTSQTGNTISNLCVGTYSVDITDGNGCMVNLTVPVTNVGGPTGESISSNDPSCFGGSDGDALVTPIGGTAPYTYVWIHDNSTSNSISNLSSGTYYLQVTDDNGCIRTVEVSIDEPAAITDMNNITPATCGLCDGEITVSGNGGTGGFSYVWSHGPTSQNITGLCEGLYFLDITDANGCVETFEYGVNGATGTNVVLTPSPASCDGICDGSAISDTIGGTQPMTYVWMDVQGNPIGQTSDNASGLCIGDYILEVTDGAGCISYAQTTITGPTGFDFSIPTSFDALCSGSADGEAHAIVIGGTLPYTYTWIPAPAAGQTTSTATGLSAGTYTVTVIDANGCTDNQDIIVGEPTPIAIAIDSIQDALCLNSSDGYIEITATGGTPGYTYGWTSIPSGFTSTDEDIYNLFPQNYIVTVTDLNGCTETDTLPVDTMIVVLADAGPDTAYCEGFSLEIIGQGTGSSSLSYTWYDDLGNIIDPDSALLVNDLPGTYTYILEVADGSCTHYDTVQVTVNPTPIADAGLDVDIIKGEETVIGGNPSAPGGSSVIWIPNIEISDTSAFNPTVDPDSTTIYYLSITDTNGCTATDSVIVRVFPEIVFPNGFSPNGDGVNETWEIDFIKEFEESVVEVYNRWGDLLFRSVGYVQEWDGNYNGKELPVGTYYYIIELNHPLYPEPFTGPITILR